MSMKVLIVEPDWDFTRLASAYLEAHAHHVVQEARLDDALRRAAHWQPDLVIVAAELAEDNFLSLLDETGASPAVLLTGWLDRYDIAWRAWQQGGDELLMKPVFNTGEVHEAIVTALENAAGGTRTSRLRPKAIPA